MSIEEARAELASIAASLRAYLEWHVDSGSGGIPRKPRGASGGAGVQPAAAASSPPPVAVRPPPERIEIADAPVAPPIASAQPSSLLRDPFPPSSLPEIPPASRAPDSALHPTPSSLQRRMDSAPPPAPPSIVQARPLPVLQETVRTCTACALHATRTNTVFARGNPEAQLCFVGEAPGADEDAQGIPFVGRAGQLLDRMIGAMGLDPQNDVYVCNIIKCRPPGNRRPEPEETATCIPYLHEQLAQVGPKVIVALGNTAVGALLGTKLGITKVRGSWKLYRGKIPVMPTFHPSYLLRPGPAQSEAKRQAWEDLQAVMKDLGLQPPPKK